MEESVHNVFVGAGAKTFALEHGFEEEEVLTEAAAESYKRWVGRGSPRSSTVAVCRRQSLASCFLGLHFVQ